METDVMRKLLVLFAVAPTVLYLSACADTATLIATPDKIAIRVIPIWYSGPAVQMAEAHCAQFGKDARLAGKYGRTMQFVCVPRL